MNELSFKFLKAIGSILNSSKFKPLDIRSPLKEFLLSSSRYDPEPIIVPTNIKRVFYILNTVTAHITKAQPNI